MVNGQKSTAIRYLCPMEFLKQHVEALIFASPQSISVADLKSVLDESLQTELSDEALAEAIEQTRLQFQQEQYAFELVEIAGGWQFLTKGAYHNSVAVHLKQTTKKRLSQAALETLALIAYKQPVSRSELEDIRGVSCDYALQKLLDKELVFIVGRSEGPGRPLLYGTTEKFMDYLGINSLTDLPKPKDFKEVENSVGEVPALEEFTPSEPAPSQEEASQPEN
jgi:segregation and condensation protein B